MAASGTERAVRVGDWVVEPALDTISRGGVAEKLEPRAMRLLMCLVDSEGAVVSIDRLLSDVWAGVIVGPASVYQAISQLRKILGDTDPEPTYIATVPRKGYRLVATVQAVDPVPQTPAATGRLAFLRSRLTGLSGIALVGILVVGLLSGGVAVAESTRRPLQHPRFR